MPEDDGLDLITHRRGYKWYRNPDHGALTPTNDGTGYGYHEFQMYFYNFAAEPGEVIKNIRLRDYFHKEQEISMTNGTSPTGEETITERCHVITAGKPSPSARCEARAEICCAASLVRRWVVQTLENVPIQTPPLYRYHGQ